MAVIDARARNVRVLDELRLVDARAHRRRPPPCALVPGVSRSGATICCCALLLGLRRTREAARPLVPAQHPAPSPAPASSRRRATRSPPLDGADAVTPLVAGTLAAAVTGYLVDRVAHDVPGDAQRWSASPSTAWCSARSSSRAWSAGASPFAGV
ncbi:MAG: undecaprenyl-diphosphate phosphatase [Kofleriaceae bacterium]|nr:undecaprenyl-diphosphate phosphatase [Kofleriaceae bacterium]